MGNPLRDRRSPSELAASGQVIDFSLKISQLAQLAAIVKSDLNSLEPDKLPPGWRDNEVTGRLSFGFADAQNALPKLEGRVSATLDAVCQRCLEPMALPLEVELKLLFADDEQADNDGGFEVWELEEDTLRPMDLVEEALIMAIPLAPMHGDDESCRRPADDDDDNEDGAEMVRPFAALRAQMDNDN